MWPYFIRIALQHFAFGIIIPVVTVFWMEKGLNLVQIAWLTSIFFIASIILEIPTGYIADRWGRKKSLVASSIAVTLAFGLYAWSSNLTFVILGVIIEAIGASLMSGADEAYIYDSLGSLKQTQKYKLVLSRINMTDEIATALGMITSSAIVALSGTKNALLASTFILGVTALTSGLLLREPRLSFKKSRSVQAEEEFHHPSTFMKRMFLFFSTHRRIFFAMCGFAIMSEVARTFWQPQMLAVGLPAASFGLIFAGLKIFALLGSWIGGKTQQAIKPLNFWWLGAIMAFSLVLLSGSSATLVIIGLASLFFTENVYRLYKSTYLNQQISSEYRARTLSAGNMIASLFGAIFAAIMGSVGQVYGLGLIFMIMAGLQIISALSFFREK